MSRSVFYSIARGQSLARALMNEGMKTASVTGTVLDVGGARTPDYFSFMQKRGEITVDIVDGALQKINFETDALPYADGAYDTVVVCNVLEHIFNHRFLTNEMHRVLKQGGGLVGFVPFLFQYHPDPHDYFRYTKEALTRILKDAGFRDIAVTEIGGGPFLLNYNTLMLSVPRICRLIAYPVYAALDALFLALRPSARQRYPLGYLFTAKK